ncbi:MAG: aminoglycoside phosphotransferase family protein, partial [Sciscionella sp.]
LPKLVREVAADWGLTYDGAPLHGYCALVVPVRTAEAAPAMLKFSWPHDEEEHEYVALKALDGDGMVRLLRADPHRHAMLLERLHAERDLTTLPVLEACEVVAGLYGRIHIAAPPVLRPLTSYIARWGDEMAALTAEAPIPHRLVEQRRSLAADLLADPASVGTMIHGDLHYENVLAADREPWVVIDPKPMSGDPHYEVAAMLWNRWPEALATGDARSAVRRRFDVIVERAGLDEDRARDWIVVRMVDNAWWAVQDAQRLDRPLSGEDHDWLTQCITVAKAVQG